MKRFFAASWMLLASLSTGWAQSSQGYEYGPYIAPGANPGDLQISWWGTELEGYFVKVSEDLVTWTYAPFLEAGVNDVLSIGMSSTASKLFVRVEPFYAPVEQNPWEMDLDGDGLSNEAEVLLQSTNPWLEDTDGDSLGDGFEVSEGLNPNSSTGVDGADGDKDGDGLSNYIEAIETRTGLNDADSDDDGLSDGDEYFLHGTGLKDADSDDDGLSDGAEVNTHLSDPLEPDTDGDGLPDAWEVQHSLDPASASGADGATGDPDGDGLLNSAEYTLLTLPNDSDTDNDGLSDGAEVNTHLSDPKDTDSDDDTLLDGAEALTHHSNPTKVESDGDGMPDRWEVDHGLDPASATGANGAAGDPDGDTLGNFDEYREGSDPQSSDTDGDTLSDGAEFHLHFSSPLVVDSDGDGLPDAVEVNTHHTHPALVDSDFDGLSDPFELQTSLTDAMNADTDGDHMTDGWEHLNGLNALSAADASTDLDGDGYSNLLEFYYTAWGYLPNSTSTPVSGPSIGDPYADTDNDGLNRYSELVIEQTNPNDPDTDGDWMNDGWEVTHGLNPTSSTDQWSDPDADGLPNCIEFLEDKDPAVADASGFDWNGDPDNDDLTTQQEITIHHTNPHQPDTDGDGLHDGWEIASGYNALLHNDRDPNPRNNASADPDQDGLSNLQEAYHGTLALLADTDGDGVQDNAELQQASNPLNASSSTAPAQGTSSITLTWGDPSGSHSEKYTVTITPEGGGQTRKFTNARFGQVESTTITLPKGTRHTVTLSHSGTDPKYTDEPRPDFDYQLNITENGPSSSDSAIIIDDPQQMMGSHDDSIDFSAQGKSVTVTCAQLSSTTFAMAPANDKRTKLGVFEQTIVSVSPSGLSVSNWTVVNNSAHGKLFPVAGANRTGFRAGDESCTPVVTATVGGRLLSIQYNVVKPSSYYVAKEPNSDAPVNTHPMLARMTAKWHIGPTDVSFAGIKIEELRIMPEAKRYFAPQANIEHIPGVPLAVTSTLVAGKGWLCDGSDLISGDAPFTPYSRGTFTWSIPWRYVCDGNPYQFTTVKHIKELFVRSNGKARLTLVKDKAKTEANQP